MKRMVLSWWVLLLVPAAGADEPRTLDIYFLDMVGGASTLIVTPVGESVLIDTGSLRPEHRDADRILRACEDAGLRQIDYLVTTHFDSDHFGAILEVSQRIPVKCFLDKGVRPPADEGSPRSQELYTLYDQATKGKTRTIRAGDDIPLRNDPAGKLPPIKLHCVAAEKKVEGFDGDIDAPMGGREIKPPDNSDNACSIALLLTYGPFQFFAGGDITWNVERGLALGSLSHIGPIDLYQITHHGWDLSNCTMLLRPLRPTVCVAMNGPRKGIQPRTFGDLTSLPSLKALYQIHYNTEHDGRYNPQPEFIANPKDNPNRGEFIKASVDLSKGIFFVRIGKSGLQRQFNLQPLPPDLSQCTRIEIKWSDSVLQTAHPISEYIELLNTTESEYLESLRPRVLEDPQRIKALADSVQLGRYRGLAAGVPGVRPAAYVDCYRDGRLWESFAAYGGDLIIHNDREFEHEKGFLGLWALTPNAHAPELRPFILRADCATRASLLHWFFFGRHLDKKESPSPGQWCDAIVQDSLSSGRITTREEAIGQLGCPAADKGRCHYAMNPACKLNSAPDTVLLFETKAGWNQHGGPELFTVDNHDPKGGCVVLNDGLVKFIRSEQELRQLRWK